MIRYKDLLATLPAPNYESGSCLTCEEQGFCRDRAEAITDDVSGVLASEYGLYPADAELLQWLLDSDRIGIDKDESIDGLAEDYADEEEEKRNVQKNR